MGPWTILQYRAAWNDLCAACETGLRAALKVCLVKLREQGNSAREPISKHLDGGIFELRAKRSRSIARALFYFEPGQRIVIVHGFIKKSQKTKPKDIEIAKIRRQILQGEKGNGSARPVAY